MIRMIALLLALLAAGPARAADEVIVEDWARLPVGARGLPEGWKAQNWGSPAYDFTVVTRNGHRALHLRSREDSSTIVRDISGTVDLATTPVLEWTWKVTALPAGGDSCQKATDDQAAQIYVVWPRFPQAVRSRVIGYVWDSTRPAGTICKSEKTGTVTYIVVRSGPAALGQWLREQRDVREDYRAVYGEEPDAPGAVSIAIDSNDTRSAAEAYIGAIRFRRR